MTIPSEIIERAARAIFFRPNLDGDSARDWEAADELVREAFRQDAEAALTAAGYGELREALEAIVERGVDAGGMEIARAALAIGRGEKKWA